MDWAIYWFMFPVSICVATAAMLSGIGGAALLTQAFGFSSGFVGYYRRGLIDFRAAAPFILVAAPVGVVGALLAHQVNQSWLKAAYAVLMILLFFILMRHRAPVETALAEDSGETDRGETDRGAAETGMVSVGIGEAVMPQLVRRNRVPLPVAAAISVLIVIVTMACASFTRISALIAAAGVHAAPWNLVCWTIPSVIVGGQIGPRLQGAFTQRSMETAIAILFGIISPAMLWIAVRELFP